MKNRESINAQICFDAIREYGNQSQLDMVVEELAELIQAIQKLKRNSINGKIKRDSKEVKNVISEMADVTIMLFQLQQIVGITDESIFNEMNRKLDRLKKRINAKKSV